MTERLRRTLRQAITDLSAGLPVEPVLLRLLRALEAEEADRLARAGQKEETP